MSLTLFLAAYTVAAEAAPPTAEALAKVGTIDIVVQPERLKYAVRIMGNGFVGLVGGGLIPGLIADSVENQKSDQLTSAFRLQNVAFNSYLAEQLLLKLTAAGYLAAIAHGEWDLVDGKHVYRKDSVHSTADSVLFVAPVLVGFVATGANDEYLPSMMVMVTLLDKDGRPPFFFGSYASGWNPKNKFWRSSPPKKTFRDFQALVESPLDSAATLYDAAQDIASSVADDLKK